MDMLHDKWYKVVPCGKRSFAVTEVSVTGGGLTERIVVQFIFYFFINNNIIIILSL